MKKKLALLLIFIVSFLGFGINVFALDDHSLLYDISSFNYDKSTITIKGFATLHNYNNNNSQILIYFVDSNGNKVVDFSVEKDKNYISLTKWYCTRTADNVCSSSSYDYDNVGFMASLNLSEFTNSSSFKYNSEYALKIKVCIENGNRCLDDDFGVPLGVISGNNDDIKITNSTSSMTIYTQSSRLLSNNWGYGSIQSGGVYWEQYETFDIVGIKNGENNCNSGATQYDYCPNLYELNYKKLNNQCVSSSNKGISGYVVNGSDCSAWASGAWGKPNGTVTISFKNKGDTKPDKVCTNENKTIDSCSSSNLTYNCDKMKIKTKFNNVDLTAYVKINEYGRFTMTSYAGDNVEVIAGQGFSIGMSYIYNLTWEMFDIECNGIDDETCRTELYSNLKSISLKEVSSEKLNENLNNTGVKETVKFKENTDENLSSAGSWVCNGQIDDDSNAATSGGASIICQYKIKDAYINYNTGYITYKDKSGQNRFKNLGSYFYIPLNYSGKTFSWNIDSNNISLVNVRTIKENYTSSIRNVWTIDTSENENSQCFVNVKKGSLTPPDPDAESDNEANIVYRSVDTDISDDESTLDSNLKLYYLEESTNWYNYFYDVKDDGSKSLNRSHFNRIKTTFNNLHYSTVVLTNSKIKSLLNSYDSENYTNWFNIDSNGISGLISSDYFDVKKNRGNIHCKWGEFNELTCDKYNS